MSTWKTLIYLLSIFVGSALIFLALRANHGLGQEVIAVASQYAAQEEGARLSQMILGLISGGHFVIVPLWQIRAAMIIGGLLLLLGVAGLQLGTKGLPFRQVFSRRYWSTVEY